MEMLEITHTALEKTNFFDRSFYRLGMVEKRIRELEKRSVEIIQCVKKNSIIVGQHLTNF